jgi:hypothetical protein
MSKDLKPDARLIAEEFLNERWRARAGQFAAAGFDSPLSQPTAAEDALARDLLDRIYGSRPTTPVERQYLRRKLGAARTPTGEHVPAALWVMTPMERLKLEAILGVLDHAAGA